MNERRNFVIVMTIVLVVTLLYSIAVILYFPTTPLILRAVIGFFIGAGISLYFFKYKKW